MSAGRSLISPTSNPLLEQALHEKLRRRSEAAGSLGELEPLAIRIGLMQGSLKPRLVDPQVLLFAADHGLVVDGLVETPRYTTREQVLQLLSGRLPVSVFAGVQGMQLALVDAGVADNLRPHDQLLLRKIAYGTRHPRVGSAMTVEQAHAAIRAGMEIGDALPGNAVACAGLGVGSNESAALVLARLTELPLHEFLGVDALPSTAHGMHLLQGAQAAMARHRELTDPVEVVAAFGGFETAMMVGLMLVAASRRRLIMVDGMAACAALLVASRIAAPVIDYCVFCRSHAHPGLDRALEMFRASALLELGLQSVDGTGATLAWPLVRTAAALLTEVAEGEDAGPTRPSGMAPGDFGVTFSRATDLPL